MDPELRRVLTWMSRILSWLFSFLAVAITVTALPPELLASARLPRPYALAGLDPLTRLLSVAACAGFAHYLHTLARGLGSGTLDYLPRPRLPWEREP